MKHLGTKTIETSRLVLRPFVISDAEAMYRNWAKDPEVTEFLRWSTFQCVDTAQTVLGDWVKRYSDGSFYQWAIELKDLGEPIGSISVVNQDDALEMAEIGYCIGRPWWGQGIVTEALAAVMGYLFEEVGFLRIEAGHDPDNPASGGVMRKCGMKYEGTLRRRLLSNRGITDIALYSMLREEWSR